MKWLVIILLLFETPSFGRIYQSFADISERSIPGVVNIRTTQYISGRNALLDPYQFFTNGRLPRGSKTNALGSGVIIDTRGYVITNYHVVEGASTIEILVAKSKKKVKAKLIGADKKTDLALLKVKPWSSMRVLDFGDSDRLRVGDIVLAIGNPFGFAHTVTSGIISAKGRVIGTGPYDSFLQTDASIHPGNSGGPLIDIRGRVIGINTAVSSQGASIGFAIPSNMVKKVVRDLKKHGKVIRPWLGIVGKNILAKDELGDQYDPAGVYGVLVDNLIVEGPAYNAGIRVGDLIMELDQRKVFDLNQLQRELSNKNPGKTTRVKIYRRSQGFMQIKIRLNETPSSRELPQEKDLF